MTTTLKPLFDRIVLEMVPLPLKAGRLHIPDSARVPSNEGKVLAVGPAATSVKVDDLVLLGEHRGSDIRVDGKILRIVEEGGIMAIIERSSLVTV